MHNGTVGLDRSLNDLIVILEVDYDDLRLVTVGEGLSDTNVMIGFQSLAYSQVSTFEKGSSKTYTRVEPY